jgi:hypothetical protein
MNARSISGIANQTRNPITQRISMCGTLDPIIMVNAIVTHPA